MLLKRGQSFLYLTVLLDLTSLKLSQSISKVKLIEKNVSIKLVGLLLYKKLIGL